MTADRGVRTHASQAPDKYFATVGANDARQHSCVGHDPARVEYDQGPWGRTCRGRILPAESQLLSSAIFGAHRRLRPNLVDQLADGLGLRRREESRVPDFDRHNSNHG
jgi:hypothetical protein